MAVRIAIEADVSGAKSGFAELQKAIKQTGQEATKLKDLKFDPAQFGAAAKQADLIRKNLNAINQTDYGQKMRQRAKGAGQDDSDPRFWDFGKMYGNPVVAKMERRRFLDKLQSGPEVDTYQPLPTAPAGSPPPPREVQPATASKAQAAASVPEPEPIFFDADTHFAELKLEKLQQAIEQTNQAGKKFKDIKLDGKQFAEGNRQLLDVRKNMDDIFRTAYGKEIKKRIAQSNQDADKPLDLDWNALFPNDQKRASDEMQRFWGKARYGVKHEPEPLSEAGATPEAQSGSGSTGSGQSGGGQSGGPGVVRRMGGWAVNQFVGAGSAALGLAGVGSLIGALVQGYREHLSVLQSTDEIYKRLFTGQDFDAVQKNVRDLGEGLQLSASEAGNLAKEFIKTSGDITDPFEKAKVAGQFGRGIGVDPAQSAQMMGQAALVGYGNNRASQREFAALLANTIGQSHMFARSEQVMTDLVGQISNVANREGRTAGTGEMGKFSELLGALYLNPAMRGGGAQNVMQSLNNLGSGGNMQQEMFAWSAFGKMAKNDYINLEKIKDASPFATEKDIFGSGDDRTTKLDLGMAEAQKYADGLGSNASEDAKTAYMLKILSGMGMNLGENFIKSWKQIGSMDGGTAGFTQWMQDSAKTDITSVNPEALGNLSKLYHESFGQAGLTPYERDLAKQYQGSDKTSQADRDKLKDLLDSNNESMLKQVLPEIVAKTGGVGNEAEDSRKSQADLMRGLESLGDGINDLVLGIRDASSGILSLLHGDFGSLSDHLGRLTEQLGRIGSLFGIGTANASMGPMVPGVFGGSASENAASQPGAGGAGASASGDGSAGAGATVPGTTIGDRIVHGVRRVTGGNMAKDPYFRAHIGKLEKERGIPQNMLAKIMMTESGGDNRGYHYKDGSYNPKHSDYGLFGIKKDYTGKDPGYGVKPLKGTSPEEQARFAADYLAASIKETGSPESGMAAYHTGIGGWMKGDPATRADGNKYVDYTSKKVLPKTDTEMFANPGLPGNPSGSPQAPIAAPRPIGSGGKSTHDWPKNLSLSGRAAQRGLKGVDPLLVDAIKAAASVYPGKAEIFSSTRPRGDKGNHSSGNALDVRLYDKNGKVIPEHFNKKWHGGGSDQAHVYERFMQDAVAWGEHVNPGFANETRWGGNFGEGDWMHLDRMRRLGRGTAAGDLKSGRKLALGGETKPIIGGDWDAHYRAVYGQGDDLPAMATADVPKYHTGGIVGKLPNTSSKGLMSGEVPAILMRGEEVLTAKDPRHANNIPKVPTNYEAPKTPDEIDRVIRSMNTPEAINARWQGQVAMEVVFRDTKGNVIQKRNGLAVSEPRIPGSGGSDADMSRFIWNDSVTMPG